jgi:hypothetical protein
MSIGDLDRDSLKKLVAKTGETTRLDRLDQHVEVFRSDDDGRSPFVQVAPENPVGLRCLLPRDEGRPMRIARIGVACGGVDEGR